MSYRILRQTQHVNNHGVPNHTRCLLELAWMLLHGRNRYMRVWSTISYMPDIERRPAKRKPEDLWTQRNQLSGLRSGPPDPPECIHSALQAAPQISMLTRELTPKEAPSRYPADANKCYIANTQGVWQPSKGSQRPDALRDTTRV